jgi:hypothetical protein
MPWFLVDDQFPTDDRVLAVSLAARGLWVMAGAWSSAHRTDVVPDHVLASLGSTPELVTELTAARIIRRAKGGQRLIQEGLCKIPSPETVDNQRKLKTERQRRWRQTQRRRDVDASTAPSTWSPDPGPDPVVEVINRTNGSSPRASPDVIDSIMKEVHARTGRNITPDWAQRVADHILKGDVANPAAYVRQAIRNEPNPRQRFLPLY